jgi:hypothetical protein
VATFADDTAVMAVGDSVEGATEILQRAVDKVNNWTRKCLIKPNDQQKMSTYSDNYKSQSHTSLKHRKIPWHDAR